MEGDRGMACIVNNNCKQSPGIPSYFVVCSRSERQKLYKILSLFNKLNITIYLLFTIQNHKNNNSDINE